MQFSLSLSLSLSLPSLTNLSLPVARDQLVNCPVLVAPVGQEPSNDERHLLLSELLRGDLERVSLPSQLDHHGGVHAVFFF